MIIDGNNFIAHKLKTGRPFAAGKIGITELNIMYAVHNLIPTSVSIYDHLRHEVEDIAGLYPFNEYTAKHFMRKMEDSLNVIDLIPQWNKVIPKFEERILASNCSMAYRTLLQHLEPYFFDKPWTDQLEGKKVLVFSPFAESIQRNYQNLHKIWCGKIKPNFELKAVKYPFAIALDANSKYKSSNEVYIEYLKLLHAEMPKHDVGIFGTGYTSLLFAAECKQLGKAGIHLGGATQILFGIRGQRWREIAEFQPFFNEHWTDPLPIEIPDNYKKVEGGCYW